MNTATTLAHKDVKGKELYYLKITNGTSDVLINVGKSTFDKVKDLEKQTELPLNTTNNESSKLGNKGNAKR